MIRDLSLPEFDYILVGGGLQSGLLALALRHHRPDVSVLLIERERALGGNHTWSFHPGDVPETCRGWIDPLIEHSWPDYQVRLGNLRRRVGLSYASISSRHFADVISRLFVPRDSQHATQRTLVGSVASGSSSADRTETPCGVLDEPDGHWRLLTNTDVIHVSEDRVLTAGGEVFRAGLVIDCRGPSDMRSVFAGCGYQKFFGFEVQLKDAWPCDTPVLMDASADQTDGFRFMYTLPFTSRRVLIEETRFADTPTLDRQGCLDRVTKYLRSHDVHGFDIVREESGVLPMPFSSELRPAATAPLAGGYAGGWFHAATGYSFPMAVAFAESIASVPFADARVAVEELADEHRWQSMYARFLNRLLFRLVTPHQRHRIFRRFYRVLSDDAIERFYSHRFTVDDAARIVVGLPPTVIGLRPLRFVHSFFRGHN